VADDNLSAALEEDREALAALRPAFELPLDEARASFAAGVLLARAELAMEAVLAALALHGCEPWYLAASDCGHPEPEDDMSDEWQDWDDSHVTGSGGILICRETQIDSFCRECTRLNYGDGEPEGDDFVSAPCGTRKAVLAALTGKDKTDGQ
jgi:hypothetical protein